MCSTLAAAQAATAAPTMIAPCERLSTPETPKISVKPVSPSAYSALMAKPSMRICQKTMRRSRRPVSRGEEKRKRAGRRPALAGSGRQLDEGRELHRSVGKVLRPHVDLLAILPLQHEAGDVAGSRAQAVHVRIALGQEFDAADRADVVGLFHRRDDLVAVGR